MKGMGMEARRGVLRTRSVDVRRDEARTRVKLETVKMRVEKRGENRMRGGLERLFYRKPFQLQYLS